MPGSGVISVAGDAPLAVVGGKARSLRKLEAAGQPVPPGFVITTQAYREFIAVNSLDASDVLTPDMFVDTKMPADIADAIASAYAQLGNGDAAVAVRSSATAEDLPTLSFAGQQESFLNVRGSAAVCKAVQNCWASLWTQRAVAYRRQMHVERGSVAMAVIVQTMVPAETSGVLFTANPATGERNEIVVNAAFGLGESVVGGHLTPDTFIVRRDDLELKEAIVGDKQTMIVSADEQGTSSQLVSEEQSQRLSLEPAVLRELVSLSLEVQELFGGVPQDIEWAWAEQRLWLLQARPITNLPPPPLSNVRWEPPKKGEKLVRRQVVEHMPDPLSTLFADLYLHEGFDEAFKYLIDVFRLPAGVVDIVQRPFVVTVNGFAYTRVSFRIGPWTLLKVLAWYVTSLRRLLRTMVPRWRDEALPAYLAKIEEWKSSDIDAATDEALLRGIRELTVADACYWLDTSIVVGAAKVTDAMLDRFLRSRAVKGSLSSGRFLVGFESTTLQARRELEAIATRARATHELLELIESRTAAELLEALRRSANGRQIADDVDRYLDRYGHQIFSLDFAEPTLADEPLPVMLNLKALVHEAPSSADELHAELVRKREALVDETMQSFGPVRRWLFRRLLRWAQNYGPYREEALFFVGAAWPTLRRYAHELGRRLVDADVLESPDDIFFINRSELESAIAARREDGEAPRFQERCRSRRELRESRKRFQPPAIIPEKDKFTFGPFDLSGFASQKKNVADARLLKGFAVSPGRVTGIASVILSPADFAGMEPNSILVCPTTTPAWTPLFAQARGLVTDIGGILSHGSIVAREYGIPAVMGTGNLSRRIVSGQRITVDGDAGTVEILDE